MDTDRQKSELRRTEAHAGFVFVVPATVLYVTFVLLPIAVTVVLAFTYYDPLGSVRWAGLDNFVRFFSEPRSLRILGNTMVFTFFAVIFNVGVGLLLALALNRTMPPFLLYFFRLSFFLPVIIAGSFIAIVWTFFYRDEFGVFNWVLARLGMAPIRWVTSSRNAMASIVFTDVWKNTGFAMIIFIAALQSVPRPLIDAATMDGASPWRRFRRITLPWISPVIFFMIVLASIGALQVYESIIILTKGGPGDGTRSMSIYIVEQAFGSFEVGFAAAISVVLTAIILVITSIQFVVSKRWVQS